MLAKCHAASFIACILVSEHDRRWACCRLNTTLKQQTWQPFLIPEPEEATKIRMNWIQQVPTRATPEPAKPARKKRAPVATLDPGPALEENDPPELHADDEEPAPLEVMDVHADDTGGAEWPAAEWPVDEGPGETGGDDFAYDDGGDDHVDVNPVFPGEPLPVVNGLVQDSHLPTTSRATCACEIPEIRERIGRHDDTVII